MAVDALINFNKIYFQTCYIKHTYTQKILNFHAIWHASSRYCHRNIRQYSGLILPDKIWLFTTDIKIKGEDPPWNNEQYDFPNN